MKLWRIFLAVLAGIMILSGYSQASDVGNVDSALAQAKKDGKVVMLELGSVGCMPCEQMLPVMQKLRVSYKGKLEVLFVDVREDNKTGRQFGVCLIPTQVFLDKNGKEFRRHVRFYAYDEITPVLKKAGL